MLLLLLEVTSTPVKPKGGIGGKVQQKGLDIDLNLPPPAEAPLESREETDLPKSLTKEMKKIYNARQSAKRQERKKLDPAYAKHRREIELRSKSKWIKKLEDANGGDRQAAQEHVKAYHHEHYLKRVSRFGGRNSKKEQEVAETFKKMSRGEKVPVEEQQRALDHRKKRRMVQKASVQRIRERVAQTQALKQAHSEQNHDDQAI
ncbi:uncharacterized protein FA14DRAFT_180374 [Meira miltonrushii]|uniref:Uncharacterized protein n=1 Tax=Meira miltonrushii TaxID=1280837 RepID=A0A316V9L6_9BASI|nr:uncharacterized protein FA14DRAFT_180374 [Meira miltonrushii]PWN33738.1 hypothetical protein FA14DRAFT_180374 [Meira miltonrushii]